MTIGETVRKAIKELSDGLLGLMMPKDIRLTDDEDKGLYVGLKREEKPKRARTKKGTYKSDDKSTKDVNEAWVGGKAPTRKELLGLKKKRKKNVKKTNKKR
jgi:hypothetical protein